MTSRRYGLMADFFAWPHSDPYTPESLPANADKFWDHRSRTEPVTGHRSAATVPVRMSCSATRSLRMATTRMCSTPTTRARNCPAGRCTHTTGTRRWVPRECRSTRRRALSSSPRTGVSRTAGTVAIRSRRSCSRTPTLVDLEPDVVPVSGFGVVGERPDMVGPVAAPAIVIVALWVLDDGPLVEQPRHRGVDGLSLVCGDPQERDEGVRHRSPT